MRSLLVTVLLGVLSVPAWAQDPGDAPEHGVARISLLSGDVTVRRGDSGEDVAAELNAPLVARDHVFTEEGSRAEIQFDSFNLLRLAPQSEVRLADLRDRDYLVQISAGTITFRVLDNSDAQAEISTPTMSIRPREDGIYRVAVLDDSSTELTVRSGEAEIYVGGTTDIIRAGQTIEVSGDPSDPQRRYLAAIPRDEWDRWNESRDRDQERSDSYKYVPRHVYGAHDLYGHGRWVYDAPYGWVWVPRVSVSWAPYRVGRWVWVDFYGWTWVSGDPWGWAPYHYGRWYHNTRYGWAWYPGEPRVRYYWRPALVVFFGWGRNVGWVALAPNERYRPWYGPNRTVVVNNVNVVNNNVTVVNNINVVNTYKNARFISGRNGVTSVVSNDFGRRTITVNNFIVANNRDLQRAEHGDRWLPKEPSREHRQFSSRTVSARASSRPNVDRPFVTRPGRNTDTRSGRGDARVQPNPSVDTGRRGNGSQRNETVNVPNPGRGGGNAPAATRGNARVVPEAPADTGGRGNSTRPNESVVSPRNEPGRGRQPENSASRGGGNTPAATRGNARVQPEAPADTGRRGNSNGPNESVVFPRNEQGRGRQPESSASRGGGNAPAATRGNARVEPGAPADTSRRGNSNGPNESVVFPRNEQGRGRQPENSASRGGGNAPAATRGNARVQPEAPADTGRRGNSTGPQQNDRGGRIEQPQPRVQSSPAPSNSRRPEGNGRDEGFVRAPAEARREPAPQPRERAGGPPENTRRPEPAVRSEPQRSAPQPSRGPEVSRPSQQRAPESGSPPAARESSRGRSAPQQPSSSQAQSSDEGGSESNGRGRGRDGR